VRRNRSERKAHSQETFGRALPPKCGGQIWQKGRETRLFYRGEEGRRASAGSRARENARKNQALGGQGGEGKTAASQENDKIVIY